MLYYKINLEKSRASDGVFFPSFGSDCYEHAIRHIMFLLLFLLLLYFPLGYPKGSGPKARGSPGEKEMKTIVKNEDEW